MAKKLKYYKELSEKLKKEVELYESSYQDFEKAIDVDSEWINFTDEQKQIGYKFYQFCNDEKIYNNTINRARYPKVKEIIVERVKFLKEQKDINDKMVSLYEELDRLNKKGEIDDTIVVQLKKRAEEKYDKGTNKYNKYLEKLKNEYINNRVETVNNSIESANKEIDKNKKENGFGKVVTSAFGPIGNKVYNLYAKVHNFNVDLRKKRILNFVVKSVMVVVGTGIVASLGLTGIPQVVAGLLCLYSAYKTIRNTFKKVPDKLSLKDKVTNYKESWFRFKRSRGLGKVKNNNKLYNGIDFSKYETKLTEKTDDVESTKVEKVEKTDDVEATKVEKVEETDAVEATKVEETKKIDDVKKDKKTEKVKKANVNDFLPKINSGIQINSMNDVEEVIKNIKEQGGLKTIDDWYSLKNVVTYLDKIESKFGDKDYLDIQIAKKKYYKECENILENGMSFELDKRIKTIETFEGVDVSNNRKSMTSKIADATAQYRQQELQRIINLIQNSPIDMEIDGDVEEFRRHYKISKENNKLIDDLLEQRNNRKRTTGMRGK